MKDVIVISIVFILLALVCFGLPYWWMTSSCTERGEMESYAFTKTVGTKCYGTNDGKSWQKIWY